MKFEETRVAGSYLIRPEPRADERGFFARIFCEQTLLQRGLVGHFSQVNTGFSPRQGTLRGLHYQRPPHAEVKIARCVRGSVFDVVVDVRPQSPTFRKWFGAVLSEENGYLLYAPEGTAHGYLTLEQDSELIYFTSRPYAPQASVGIRYDDPAIGIEWPAEICVVSQADRSWTHMQ